MQNSKIYKNFELLLFIGILSIISLSALYSYLLFHTLAELYSTVIAASIFVITFNLRDKINSGYFILVGTGYLFIGGIDLLHTLAFKGMNIFQNYNANLPTQLWITARYMESLTLLIGCLFFKKRLNFIFIFLIYTAITIFTLTGIFLRIFPDCYIEGKGLTDFKIYSEYIICIILIFSQILLLKNKSVIDETSLKYLSMAIFTTILAELSFTKYISVYGFFNFLGHIFKIVSFYFIYLAFIKRVLMNPFDTLWRDLKQKEDMLEDELVKINTYVEVLDLVFVVIDNNQKIILINENGAKKLGYTKEELLGKNWFDLMIPENEREITKIVFDELIEGKQELVAYFENEVIRKDGTKRIYGWHNSFLRNKKGEIIATVSAGEDLTEKVIKDKNREKLIKELEQALKEIKTLKGLIRICAWCKKIKDEDGRWIKLETYLQQHTDVELSHGICPECFEKVKKEIQKDSKYMDTA